MCEQVAALSRFEEHKSSGFSFSGSSISYGSQQQSTDQENQSTGSVASAVGAIAGNVSITAGQTYNIRSTDAETGIARIFEKERVQKEIDAQVKITEMFGREASKAIGDHAAVQMKQAGSLTPTSTTSSDLVTWKILRKHHGAG